ncbi:cutinase family protein [Leifsonia sp. RAF41]|uniref:cutinase family protein n=1 Tax=Leifsonia sp. RAF41 TaxID=3233056 RepID=UPI003F9E2E1A
MIIGIRGTNEPAGTGTTNGGRTYVSGGLGDTVNAVTAGAGGDPEIPYWVEALNYPAVAMDPGNPQANNYQSSLEIGVANLRGEIENLASSCPASNIVLVGYSQGAQGITNVLSGASGSLTTNAKNHIGAVVMYGAPTFHFGESWNAGTGVYNGIFGLSGTPALGNYKRLAWLPPSYSSQGMLPIIRSYCLAGDEFCQGNYTAQGAAIHGSYAASSLTTAGWGFIRGWLTDNN